MNRLKKTSNKIVNFILVIIIVITVILLLSLGYSKFIKNDKFVNIFGYTYMTVQSNSMYPEFIAGDKLIIKLGKNFRSGDIVTYEVDGIYVTHRVISKNGTNVITKGDSNNTNDSPINENTIVGVVKYIIK